MRIRLLVVLLALAAPFLAMPGRAETGEVRIAQQFGISYLPLMVMRHERLLEAEAAKAGVPGLKVAWAQFGAGNAMNEALISGNLDIASGGITPLITIWSKTRARQEVRGMAALSAMPLYLNTTSAAVKTVADFTDKDRIAVTAVKISLQSIVLQMEAARLWGDAAWRRFDPLTVSMTHPDGFAAMMSGRSEVTAHFTAAPYQYQELEDPRVHRVLSSYDVLGGPHTFNTLYTTKAFHGANPKLYRAILAALDAAAALIAEDPVRAAGIYLEEESSKLSRDFVERIIRDPETAYAGPPRRVMQWAAFMHKIGSLDPAPAAWTDLFFPEIHQAGGS
jgi:NitT/TauT family transport system substrate-binding protein